MHNSLTLSLVVVSAVFGVEAAAEPAHLVRPADEPFRVEAIRALGVKTGRRVMYNDVLVVEATGTVTLSPTQGGVGPAGTGEVCGPDCLNPEGHRGALTGVVIEPSADGMACVFEIGAAFDGQLRCQGKLVLVVNDDDYLDNRGAFAAKVGHRQPTAPTCWQQCSAMPRAIYEACLTGTSSGTGCGTQLTRYTCMAEFFDAMENCANGCGLDPQHHACSEGCATATAICIDLMIDYVDCEDYVQADCIDGTQECLAGCLPNPP